MFDKCMSFKCSTSNVWRRLAAWILSINNLAIKERMKITQKLILCRWSQYFFAKFANIHVSCFENRSVTFAKIRNRAGTKINFPTPNFPLSSFLFWKQECRAGSWLFMRRCGAPSNLAQLVPHSFGFVYWPGQIINSKIIFWKSMSDHCNDFPSPAQIHSVILKHALYNYERGWNYEYGSQIDYNRTFELSICIILTKGVFWPNVF